VVNKRIHCRLEAFSSVGLCYTTVVFNSVVTCRWHWLQSMYTLVVIVDRIRRCTCTMDKAEAPYCLTLMNVRISRRECMHDPRCPWRQYTTGCMGLQIGEAALLHSQTDRHNVRSRRCQEASLLKVIMWLINLAVNRLQSCSAVVFGSQ